MKKYLACATIILMLLSCSSCKSKADNTIKHNKTDSLIKNDLSDLEKLKQTNLNQIGDLTLGMPATAILKKMGEPISKTKAEVWGADGWVHQDWAFTNKGILLNMSSEKDSSSTEVFSITITSPSQLKTNKNIGIGSTYDEVMTEYEKDIDKTASDENVVTIGSLYGGIIIEFKEKKAVKIFLGAAAE